MRLVWCRIKSASCGSKHGELHAVRHAFLLRRIAQSREHACIVSEADAVLLQAPSAAAPVNNQKSGGSSQALESLPQVGLHSLCRVQMSSTSLHRAALRCSGAVDILKSVQSASF